MAKPANKTGKKISKKPTMRELANSGNSKKKRSLKSNSLSKSFKKLKRSEKKSRKFIKLPNNKFGRILDAIIFSFPRYLKGAWGEIKQTTWPNRKETLRLTFAVFIFSTVFAVFVAVLDFALDKVFKSLITK